LNCLKGISARWLRQRDQVHTHTERPWPLWHFAASAGSARWRPSCSAPAINAPWPAGYPALNGGACAR